MENWGLITGRGAVYEYVVAVTLRFYSVVGLIQMLSLHDTKLTNFLSDLILPRETSRRGKT